MIIECLPVSLVPKLKSSKSLSTAIRPIASVDFIASVVLIECLTLDRHQGTALKCPLPTSKTVASDKIVSPIFVFP